MNPIEFDTKIQKKIQTVKGLKYDQYFIFIPTEHHEQLKKGQGVSVIIKLEKSLKTF